MSKSDKTDYSSSILDHFWDVSGSFSETKTDYSSSILDHFWDVSGPFSEAKTNYNSSMLDHFRDVSGSSGSSAIPRLSAAMSPDPQEVPVPPIDSDEDLMPLADMSPIEEERVCCCCCTGLPGGIVLRPPNEEEDTRPLAPADSC